MHPDRIIILENALNSICPQYGINVADIMHEFLANVLVESSCFARYEENLSYSAKRLTEVWPHRFPDIDTALAYEHNPRLLAAKVYDGRADLGNTQPGDGFAFRGSGPIQLTGRRNMEKLAAYLQNNFGLKKSPEEVAELIRTSDEWGIHSACWLFSIAKKLNDEALDDMMKDIVKRINGGLTGYPDRLHYYYLCKQLITD